MSLADKNVDVAHLHPQVKQVMDWLVMAMKHYTGVEPVITSGFRSVERQAELYADRANNPYPVNRPGDSAHNFGLAFDSYVPAEWDAGWRYLRTAVGLRVPDDDKVHAEVPEWRKYVR